MLCTYEIKNPERKERKARKEEISKALGSVGSWRFGLVKVRVARAREIER